MNSGSLNLFLSTNMDSCIKSACETISKACCQQNLGYQSLMDAENYIMIAFTSQSSVELYNSDKNMVLGVMLSEVIIDSTQSITLFSINPSLNSPFDSWMWRFRADTKYSQLFLIQDLF